MRVSDCYCLRLVTNPGRKYHLAPCIQPAFTPTMVRRTSKKDTEDGGAELMVSIDQYVKTRDQVCLVCLLPLTRLSSRRSLCRVLFHGQHSNGCFPIAHFLGRLICATPEWCIGQTISLRWQSWAGAHEGTRLHSNRKSHIHKNMNFLLYL